MYRIRPLNAMQPIADIEAQHVEEALDQYRQRFPEVKRFNVQETSTGVRGRFVLLTNGRYHELDESS